MLAPFLVHTNLSMDCYEYLRKLPPISSPSAPNTKGRRVTGGVARAAAVACAALRPRVAAARS